MVSKKNWITVRSEKDGNLVPNKVREWRLFRGFKMQVDLAKASGVPSQTINRLESFKLGWTRQTLEPLAKALKCHIGDLISRDPGKKEADIFAIYGEDQVELPKSYSKLTGHQKEFVTLFLAMPTLQQQRLFQMAHRVTTAKK